MQLQEGVLHFPVCIAFYAAPEGSDIIISMELADGNDFSFKNSLRC
jgi:hypothetical protein